MLEGSVIWDPRLAEVETIAVTSQVVHTSIMRKTSKMKFLVTFVYGLHSVVERRPLWESLNKFGTNMEQPWLIMGDFNSVLITNDRHGHAQFSSYEVRDFLNCCIDLGLEDINSSGSHFTWANGSIWSKIGRALCKQEWFAPANFLLPGCIFDHSPYVVALLEHPRRPKSFFIFFNMWEDHEDFVSTVETN